MRIGRLNRTAICLVLFFGMLFLASCGIVSVDPGKTEAPDLPGTTAPDKPGTPDWTTDGGTYPSTDVKCFFEYSESGVSVLPRVTHAYLADGSAAKNGSTYPQYTFIRVETEVPSGMTFVGWSVGKPYDKGGTVVSTELAYSFRIESNPTYLYANFVSPYPAVTTMVYHLNGGASNGKDVVTDTVDTSFFTAPNTRYDDGSFTREGYVLLEYNTKADGTGDAYSPGSKANAENGKIDLYCIWAEASTGFTTANDSYKVSWKETYSGVAITGWSGDGDTLVIPEKIDGKDVVSIKAGAITNKSFTTLVLPRTLRKIEDGAFTGCASLKTLYMGDGILSISNAAFDEATYSNWTDFRLTATTAPRFAADYDGGYRVKWDRLMRGVASGKKLVVFVSGSSSLHGVSTEYLDKLLGDEYFVVEYGTVRTTNNMVYMEAVANFVHEGDIVVYAPENSIYQFGCPTLTYKLFRDLESSQNVWRYIDVSKYENLFGAFLEYQNKRWSSTKRTYTDHPDNMSKQSFDENGDFHNYESQDYCVGYGSGTNNHGYFTVTLNEMVNSITAPTGQGISLSNAEQWIQIGTYADEVKRVIGKVEKTGATVYFGFCPVNENALTANARTPAQQAAFDTLIEETFGIELLGSCSYHLFDWIYMYKGSDGSDFHLNDYGRAINTYKVYTELCAKLGITPVAAKAYGTDFAGCKFE